MGPRRLEHLLRSPSVSDLSQFPQPQVGDCDRSRRRLRQLPERDVRALVHAGARRLVGRRRQAHALLLGPARRDEGHRARRAGELRQRQSAGAGTDLWRRALESLERGHGWRPARYPDLFGQSVVERRARGNRPAAVDRAGCVEYLVSEPQSDTERHRRQIRSRARSIMDWWRAPAALERAAALERELHRGLTAQHHRHRRKPYTIDAWAFRMRSRTGHTPISRSAFSATMAGRIWAMSR